MLFIELDDNSMFYLLINGNSLMMVKIITDIVLSLNTVAEIKGPIL